MSDPIPFKTVARHNRPGNAWIVINESVYDISRFAHPGGLEVLEPFLGRDATAAFFSQHNLDMLAIVEKNLVGVIDRDDEEWKQERAAAKNRTTDSSLLARRATLAAISNILNTRDMAQVSESVMDPPGWAYYASAADDEHEMVVSSRFIKEKADTHMRRVSAFLIGIYFIQQPVLNRV